MGEMRPPKGSTGRGLDHLGVRPSGASTIWGFDHPGARPCAGSTVADQKEMDQASVDILIAWGDG